MKKFKKYFFILLVNTLQINAYNKKTFNHGKVLDNIIFFTSICQKISFMKKIKKYLLYFLVNTL